MNTPEIININEISETDKMPSLSVTEDNDMGTIKINNIPPIDTSTQKSVNFGPGADLLMNQVKANKQGSPKSDIKLSELNSLDVDTNNKGLFDPNENVKFNIGGSIETEKPLEEIKELKEFNDIKIGLESSKLAGDNKNETWDDFKKFNDIPVNPELTPPEKPKLSNEEVLRLKFSYIRKLEALEKQGMSVSKKYNMDDKLEEMQGEYEMIKNEVSKKNSVKFQAKMLMAFVSGIEFLNNRFDPFDIKLDGWGESINENVDEYDEVFGELHEKYGSKAKMAPEIKLLFMLGGSAAMIHMTNTMFKSAMPGMDDIIKQNPELMQQFTQAAANTMGQQNPGFGNFMSNMMPPGGNVMPPMGSPQGPSVYQTQNSPPSPNIRAGAGGNRPDIDYARNEKTAPKRSARREMKGPSDLDDLLSGIKTKQINIKEKPDDSSTISVSELKEMQKDNIQKKSKRKSKSERSTISLNLG
tara:strand:- start:1374 stop:2783 length:1410 start_codon:yes stop_codon:yes gene_type:complete